MKNNSQYCSRSAISVLYKCFRTSKKFWRFVQLDITFPPSNLDTLNLNFQKNILKTSDINILSGEKGEQISIQFKTFPLLVLEALILYVKKMF